jgi:hypothetical protein
MTRVVNSFAGIDFYLKPNRTGSWHLFFYLSFNGHSALVQAARCWLSPADTRVQSWVI